jgi:uncharacterized protein YjbJ (UPF0337 family)
MVVAMRIGKLDMNKLRGVGDKVIGLNKELIGTLVGSERLQEAGEAQQEKATEQLKALREEAKAQGHEAKAAAAGRRQKAAQED